MDNTKPFCWSAVPFPLTTLIRYPQKTSSKHAPDSPSFPPPLPPSSRSQAHPLHNFIRDWRSKQGRTTPASKYYRMCGETVGKKIFVQTMNSKNSFPCFSYTPPPPVWDYVESDLRILGQILPSPTLFLSEKGRGKRGGEQTKKNFGCKSELKNQLRMSSPYSPLVAPLFPIWRGGSGLG